MGPEILVTPARGFVPLRFTLPTGYTPVALRAAKTKLIHPVLARMGVGW